MNTPLVSVIIPCLDAGSMLRESLGSLGAQTHGHLEVIFVDNGSSDGGPALAARIAGELGLPFQLIECPIRGVNRARNLGFASARGEFIQWLDADDRLDPAKIALQVAALRTDPATDIAYGDWVAQRWTADRKTTRTVMTLSQDDDQILRTLSGVWYPPHLYLLRRQAAQRLQDLGAWRLDRPVATDVEYSAVAALAGLRFRHVPGAVAQYNIWSDSQISGATPYVRRVETLRDIYARLATFAASEACPARLTSRHNRLLRQGWDIWRIPPGSATLGRAAGRRIPLRLNGAGRTIDLRPREAAIARALIAETRPLCSSHQAEWLARILPETGGDHVAILDILERFQREGVLQPVDPVEVGPLLNEPG